MKDDARSLHGFATSVLLAAAVLIQACGTERDGDGEATNPLTTEGVDFTIEHIREDQLRWRLTGARFEVMSGAVTRVAHPRVLLYKNGVAIMSIVGETGEIDRDTFDLVIMGQVRAVAPDGVLRTEKLLWNEADGKLVGPTDVQIQRGSSVIYGQRMIGFPDLSWVHLYDVHFRVLPEDEIIDAYSLDVEDTED